MNEIRDARKSFFFELIQKSLAPSRDLSNLAAWRRDASGDLGSYYNFIRKRVYEGQRRVITKSFLLLSESQSFV